MPKNNFKPILLFACFFLSPWLHGTILSTLGIADVASDPRVLLFVTKEGDRVVGTLTNPDETPRKEYRIKTPDGQSVTVRADELKDYRQAGEAEVEYAKRRATVADTVEAQWELAEWCRQNHFLSDRKKHLERILELQPDHADARTALGYSQVNGKWMTQEEIQESRGYQRYKGRWLTSQQIESLQKVEQREKEEKLWYAKIKRYIGWLGSSRTDQALAALSEITDPAAARALGDFLATDQPRPTKLLLIKTLVHISAANPGDKSSHSPLALGALEDPDEEVRLSCLDFLKTTKDPDVVDFFISNLDVTSGTKKYKGDVNMMINRAALALGEMGDPSAVGPLIKVLITEHKQKVVSGNPGQTSATFGNRGGGMSMGSSTKIIIHTINNEDVLTALKKLTGVSFNFDVDTWQAWYDHQTRQETPDTRRAE